MEAKHFKGPNLDSVDGDKIVAYLDLKPGKYVIFAKALLELPSPGTLNTVSASLVWGTSKDTVEAQLVQLQQYGAYDRYLTVALNLAGEEAEGKPAVLLVHALKSTLGYGKVRVVSPRLTALRVDDLEVSDRLPGPPILATIQPQIEFVVGPHPRIDPPVPIPPPIPIPGIKE